MHFLHLDTAPSIVNIWIHYKYIIVNILNRATSKLIALLRDTELLNIQKFRLLIKAP